MSPRAAPRRPDAVAQANEILADLGKLSRSGQRPVGVKFRALCSQWDWAKRSDVLTHLIHPYTAKVLPYIPILFLTSDLFIEPDDNIADVFAGTGTVLLESIIHPEYPRPAFGVEINPLARLVSGVKTTPLNPAPLRVLTTDIMAIASSAGQAEVPVYSRLDFWFLPKAQRGLGRLRWVIDNHIADPKHRDFFRVCLAATVRRCSLADPDIPPPVRLRPEKFEPGTARRIRAEHSLELQRERDPIQVFGSVAHRNVIRMSRLWDSWRKHASPKDARVVWDDATAIRFADMGERGEIEKDTSEPFRAKSCGAIITSPPYGTAQKYVRNTKLEMLWLGQIREDEITSLEQATIGTEKARQHEYADLPPFPNSHVQRKIERIAAKNPLRAALTHRYFTGISKVLREASRILRDDGNLILIIGDNMVTGIKVSNHQILPTLAEEHGLRTQLLLRDRVQARGMISSRHHTGGLVTDDWVIVLKKGH